MNSFGACACLGAMIAISWAGGAANGEDAMHLDVEHASRLSLAGTWECLLDNGDQEIWKEDVAARFKPWRPMSVPGGLIAGDKAVREATKAVSARRTVTLSREQAAQGAVLKSNGVRYGATVWVNGRQVLAYEPAGPFTLMLPKGSLREGKNEIRLKAAGWAGIRRGEKGYPLIPVGSGTQPWGRKEAMMEDLWLDFYNQAYVKRALAMPDLKAGAVTVRVWLDSAGDLPGKVDVSAEVLSADGATLVGRGQAAADGKKPVDLTIRLDGAKPWTPDAPVLYTLRLRSAVGDKPCDQLQFRFGMRTIEVADGHYRLNGQPLWLRGSNLVCEWFWGAKDSPYNTQTKSYIVDEARAMSLNCFRTHTLPPPTEWLDVCDQYGTMILAEFPLLYNYANFGYTPAELDILHRNAMLDATEWVAKLWNHPSIIVWVLSNESKHDNVWEMGPYRDVVKALDPTRPCLRSGEGTAESDDMHTCNNISRGPEGDVFQQTAKSASRRDGKRTLSNTEYMNTLIKPEEINTRFLGAPDHPDAALSFAEAMTEHTECMRRAGFDLLLPYMYAGWTRLRGGNWRPDFPTPAAAALHSSMAPVLASADLFDRNVLTGANVTTRLALIDETPADVQAEVDVYVTARNPLFVPDEDALKAAVAHDRLELVFKANAIADKQIQWKAPDKEGCYYLAVVTRRPGAKPVVSQRVIHAIDPAVTDKGLRKTRVVGVGLAADMEQWLKDRGLAGGTLADAKAPDDIVLIGDAAKLPPPEQAGPLLTEFVKSGGRAVVLGAGAWPLADLADFTVGVGASSRAFAVPDVKHVLLTGVDGEFLKRWNGLPGIVADRYVKGPAATTGRKLLWAENPQRPVVVSLTVGKGEVIICLLDFRDRLGKSAEAYDPVAERIALNLLAR